MPHDSKGRLIERGDVVQVPAGYPTRKPEAALVLGVEEGSDTCNLNYRTFVPDVPSYSITAGECVLLLKHDGSLPE